MGETAGVDALFNIRRWLGEEVGWMVGAHGQVRWKG